MAIKVLVNQLGQHFVADVKQVTNEETKELIAYWLTDARLISYVPTEDGSDTVSIRFVEPCPLSDDTEFAVSASHIVSILEPKAEIVDGWKLRVETSRVNEEAAGSQEETELLPKPERPATEEA